MSGHMHAHDGYWLGRLAMVVAVAQKAPESAREALEEFLRSEKPSAELADMLRKELKSGR